MADGKNYSFDWIPVGTMDNNTSDHRILVNLDDKTAGFLFEKQSPDSQIGFVEDQKNEGKFLVLLDKTNPDSEEQGTNLLRNISTFNIQETNTTYQYLAGSQYMSRVIVFPFTISIGEIKGISLFTINATDIDYIDRMQIAILSNTVNNIAGSKLEFFAQYGYGDGQDNLEYSGDGKMFNLLSNSEFNRISDMNCNFHFLALFVHVRQDAPNASSIGLLAKDKSGSPLVEIGKNMNYCGQDDNKTTLLRSGFIDPTTHTVSTGYSLETNLQNNFPYVEFYQVRGI